MRQVILTANPTANGLSLPCPLDYHLTPQQVLLAYEQDGATAQCTVQWSPDDPFGTFNANGESVPYATDYNTNGNWYDLAPMTALTTDTQYTLGAHPDDFPARGVRLKTNSYTSGSPQLKINQAGGIS